jgi:hypothetical protein
LKTAKGSDLSDRRKLASGAKASLIERYRAAMAASEPSRAAKSADRQVVSAAREERRAERDRLKAEEKAEQERLLKEEADQKAAAESAVLLAEQERKAEDANRIAKIVEDAAAHKIERDRRYANRKSQRGWEGLKGSPLAPENSR